MTTTVAIGYKNVLTAVVDGTATWEADAPLSNVLTPRLAQLAIRTGYLGGNFELYVSNGSPTLSAKVGMIGILNHNIITIDDSTNIEVICYFTDGSIATLYAGADFFQTVELQGDGTFQSHYFWVPTDPQFASKRVWKISFGFSSASLMVTGSKDPYTGEITQSPLQIGSIWAGPKFSPINGISIDGFSQSIQDSSQVIRSIGGQVWAEPEIRQRTGKVTFPGLLESEVYGTAPSQSLQQLAAYCGVSRPLIVLPTTSDEGLMYTQGIYGYLATPAAWNLIEKTKSAVTGQMVRLYSGTLDIVEAR